MIRNHFICCLVALVMLLCAVPLGAGMAESQATVAGTTREAAVEIMTGTTYVSEKTDATGGAWHRFTSPDYVSYLVFSIRNIDIDGNWACECTLYNAQSADLWTQVVRGTDEVARLRSEPNQVYYFNMHVARNGSGTGHFTFNVTAYSDDGGESVKDAPLLSYGTTESTRISGRDTDVYALPMDEDITLTISAEEGGWYSGVSVTWLDSNGLDLGHKSFSGKSMQFQREELGDASAISISGSDYNDYTAYTLVLCGGGQHMPSTTWQTTAEPTCTKDGLRVKTCLNCGKTLEEEKLPALGHTASAEWETLSQPSCTQDGKRALLCSVCGEALETETLPATGHQMQSDWERARDATCERNGLDVKRCTVCGDVLEEKSLPALGHQYGEWLITEAPTTSEEGVRTKECLVCGNRVSEPVARVTSTFVGYALAFACGALAATLLFLLSRKASRGKQQTAPVQERREAVPANRAAPAGGPANRPAVAPVNGRPVAERANRPAETPVSAHAPVDRAAPPHGFQPEKQVAATPKPEAIAPAPDFRALSPHADGEPVNNAQTSATRRRRADRFKESE